jgi:hypothetical protein
VKQINTRQEIHDYISGIRQGAYLLQLAQVIIAVWVGWTWGLVWGFGVYAGLFIIISISSLAIWKAGGSSTFIRVNQWFWPTITVATILYQTITPGQPS